MDTSCNSTNRLLNSSQENNCFKHGLERDLNAYNELVNDGVNSANDDFLITNSLIYEKYLTRLIAYNERTRPSRHFFKDSKKLFNTLQKQINHNYENNLEVFRSTDVNEALNYIGSIALAKNQSALYPDWTTTNIELWHRNATQNSWLGYYKDFIGGRRRTINTEGPSIETAADTIVALACGRVALADITHFAKTRSKTLGQKNFLNSMTGFVNEIDALETLAFTGIRHSAGIVKNNDGEDVLITPWVFPSPYVEDVLGNKVDIENLGINLVDRQISREFYDIKISKGGSQPIAIKPPIAGLDSRIRINARNIGSVDDDGNVAVGKHGLNFLLNNFSEANSRFSEALTDCPPQLRSYEESTAYGLALSGICVATMLANRSNSHQLRY